jgi:F0F1-type ATP synthase assembly protein I
MPDESPNPPEPPKSSGGLRDLAKAESMIQLALAVPLGCLVGWAMGTWLDHHFHQEWIAITGVILGAIGGFIQIFTTASRYLKRNS